MIFKKRIKCFMCNKPVDKDGAILMFQHMNDKGDAEISEVNLCKSCGDKMERSDVRFDQED